MALTLFDFFMMENYGIINNNTTRAEKINKIKKTLRQQHERFSYISASDVLKIMKANGIYPDTITQKEWDEINNFIKFGF